MSGLPDIFGLGGGGEKQSPTSGGSPSIDGSIFDFEIPFDFGSSATSSASGFQGPLSFGSYNSSPVSDSGNEQIVGGSIENGLPVWVWPVALIGAYLLARLRGK